MKDTSALLSAVGVRDGKIIMLFYRPRRWGLRTAFFIMLSMIAAFYNVSDMLHIARLRYSVL